MDSLQKGKRPDQMTRKTTSFDPQKEYCAPGTQMHIADVDNRIAERLERLFVQTNFTRTLCFWTIHVPNENNSAVVIPTIRDQRATHRYCSQKCHTGKQHNFDSRRIV